jgi:hypothetical protein
VLADAKVRFRKVRRAAAVAAFSAWTLAIFAGLTLVGAAFGGWSEIVAGVVLGAFAANEFRGAAMLRRIDPRGARVLGINQLALAAAVVLYAAWSLWSALSGPSPLAAATQDPALAGALGGGALGDLEGLSRTISTAVYAVLALAGLLGPGLTALYYFTRAGVIHEALRDTPDWALRTLRAAA